MSPERASMRVTEVISSEVHGLAACIASLLRVTIRIRDVDGSILELTTDPADPAPRAGLGTDLPVASRPPAPAAQSVAEGLGLLQQSLVGDPEVKSAPDLQPVAAAEIRVTGRLLGQVELVPDVRPEARREATATPFSDEDVARRIAAVVARDVRSAIELERARASPGGPEVPAGQGADTAAALTARLQRALLPSESPRVAGLEVAGICVPGVLSRGDYFDYVTDEWGRLAVIVASVTGTPDRTVLAVAALRLALRSRAAAGLPPDEVLVGANMMLGDDLGRFGQTVAALVGRFDPELCRFVFANAGGAPPFHVTASDRAVRRINKRGPRLGVEARAHFPVTAIDMEPGDSVVVFAEGVAAVRDAEGLPYGERRLAQVVANLAGLPPATLVEGVSNAVLSACGPRRGEDITLVGIKRRREQT